MQELQRRSIAVVALLFCGFVFVAARPIAVPLVLAAWAAALSRPLHERLSARLRPGPASALLTFVLLVVLIAVIALLYALVAGGLLALAEQVLKSGGVRAACEALVQPGHLSPHPAQIKKLGEQHGAPLSEIAKIGGLTVLGTLFFFFFLGLGYFGLSARGRDLYRWLRDRSPLREDHFDRIGAAFTETGRGLLTSVGLTCAIQGILSTILFLAVGVPRPFVLGFLCALFAILPLVGTPLIWIPVGVGLILGGSTGRGIVVLVAGGGVISVIELFIGPSLARLGRLKLPSELVLVSMFGGALGLGPEGLVLGPLAFRLAQEGLTLWRETRA